MGTEACRLALIGCGHQGRDHLAAADHSRCHFVAVCDPDPTARHRAATASACPGFAKVADLAARGPALDGVVVALPHHIYPQVWEEVLALQVPVLKEKPLARSNDEAATMMTAASERGVQVMVAVQRRHHPSYRALLERCRGTIPSAFQARCGLGRSGLAAGWRGEPAHSGGGALLDLGYHFLDLAMGCCDAAPTWETVRMRCGDDPWRDGLVDTAVEAHGQAGATTQVSLDLDSLRAKGETVTVEFASQTLHADRLGLRLGGRLVTPCMSDWQRALAAQLDTFAALCLEAPTAPTACDHHLKLHQQILETIDAAYRAAAGASSHVR